MTEPWNRSEGEGPDLPSLLAHRRPSPISVWIDPTSPATGVFLPYLDIDGHANGGRPWRFRGHHEVALRLLPDPADELSSLTSRCVLAVRAWAVLRNAGDQLVPLDYDAPWSYLFHLQRDLATLRERELQHLVAMAGRDGEWLGDWVAEYFDAPEVHVALSEEVSAASTVGITTPPSLTVNGTVFRAEEMPDDIAERVAALLG